MASREPLISSNTNHSHTNGYTTNRPDNQMKLNFPSSSLTHPLPHKGPWMAKDTFNGRPRSTFQLSAGSGDTRQKPETSSGSGSGQPYLNQRSIAHDIELKEVVGRGYFGVVWRAEYKGAPVAVKIFSALAEPSWEREAEIYQTTLLRHKNILGFIATDKRDDVGSTGYWLVTDYYPMGSLYDFLKINTITMPDALRMTFSIANGLAHLHVEIFGTQGKPAIAHRDIKSKNILVKNDGTCCIADLGMAVRYSSVSGIVDVPTNTRVGTRRYLAPELLNNKLNLMDFEAVKATDIWALGLVVWEMLRRTCYTEIDEYTSKFGSPPAGWSPIGGHPPTQSDLLLSIPDGTKQFVDEQISKLTSQQFDQPPLGKQPGQQETKSESSQGHIDSSLTSSSRPSCVPRGNINDRPSVPSGLSSDPNMSNPLGSVSIKYPRMEIDSNGVCEDYMLPFEDYVSLDATVDEMWEIVCKRKLRPSIPSRWSRFGPMRDFTMVLRECWYEKPVARLSALRVRKSLSEIAQHYFDINLEYD